jgi:hypothetical protein
MANPPSAHAAAASMARPGARAYVPLALGAPERRDPILRHAHDRLAAELLTGRLEGQLVARGPVHVGGGMLARIADSTAHGPEQRVLAWRFARSADLPTIPGATLKGAVRAAAEACTAACIGVRQRAAAQPAAWQVLESCRRYPGRPAELCVVCRLFGAPGYEGRLRFGEAPLVQGETRLARTTAAPQRAPFRPGTPPGRRFYRHGEPAVGTTPLEICPAGATFALRIDFVNLLPAELGLLLTALGQGEPHFTLKLGGFKPACFGSIGIEGLRLARDEPPARYLTYTPVAQEPPAEPFDPASYLASARDSNLLLPDRLEALADSLRYPGESPCVPRSR